MHRGLQFSTPALIDCKISDLKLSLGIQKTVFSSSERGDFLVGWVLVGWLVFKRKGFIIIFLVQVFLRCQVTVTLQEDDTKIHHLFPRALSRRDVQ